VANGEGNYIAETETVEELEESGRVVFRYCDREGNVTRAANPNGSVNNIAGLVNPAGNVLALMPHPERAAEPILGGGRADGRLVFESLLQTERQPA
jgi:phosphoribosylformylglycinamidine synthase